MDRTRLEKLLASTGVPTKRSTKNAVNICCPICGNDTNFHMGVFLSSLRYHCWKCKSKGSLQHLLTILGLTGLAAERALSGMPIRDKSVCLEDQVRRAINNLAPTPLGPVPRVELPASMAVWISTGEDSPALGRFLTKRNIQPEQLVDYDCRWGGNTGDWAHRLIIPVYDDFGQVAAFQARDVTGKAKAKYLSEGRMSELLYWTDQEMTKGKPHRVYIVEGIFDAWRMGWNAAATFTHGISRSQRRQLLEHDRIDEVVFAWDADSYAMNVAAARSLAPLVRRAGAVRLPDGEDPDSLGAEGVLGLEVAWA